MMVVQTTMAWEKGAMSKYQRMLAIIPVFHRSIACEVVNKKAEQLAQLRKAAEVGEEDIIRAFFSEVPKAFYSLMVRVMDEVGFQYKNYL